MDRVSLCVVQPRLTALLRSANGLMGRSMTDDLDLTKFGQLPA